MKKLMIVAAAAAMAGASFGAAQVYDAKLSVKTTTCKTGKITQYMENLGYGNKGDQVQYRKQSSRTIQGAIWGCDCETIAKPAWRLYNYEAGKTTARDQRNWTVGGYAFWDSTKSPYFAFTIPYVKFGWVLLNRIDQFTKVEGTWMLKDEAAGGESFFFLGAGFGTCKNQANECESWITSISGNFAGFMQLLGGDGDGCLFCGETRFGCLVAPFCLCEADNNYVPALTAAYGTWSIKYNSSASSKLKKEVSIIDAGKFNGAKFDAVRVAVGSAEIAVKNWFALNGDDNCKNCKETINDELKAVLQPIDFINYGYFDFRYYDEAADKNYNKWYKKLIWVDPGKVQDDADVELPSLALQLLDLS